MKAGQNPSGSDSDEVLCGRAAAGDRVAEERLVIRYNRLVRVCARPYFLAGGSDSGGNGGPAGRHPGV